MSRFTDGVSATSSWGITWRKSRRSNPSGDCVELAELAGGRMGMRHSRHPDGPALVCGRAEMVAFIRRLKDGDFEW